MRSTPSIEQQLANLPKLDVPALRSAYRRLYGTGAPRNAPPLLLRQAVANRLHQQLLARRGIYWKLYQLQYKDQELGGVTAIPSPVLPEVSADD